MTEAAAPEVEVPAPPTRSTVTKLLWRHEAALEDAGRRASGAAPALSVTSSVGDFPIMPIKGVPWKKSSGNDGIPSFDKGRAAGALSSVSLSACVSRKQVVVDVIVVWEPSGTLTSIELAGDALSQAEEACLVRHLRALRIAAFAGTTIRVHKRYRTD